jgi:hypothetical protein
MRARLVRRRRMLSCGRGNGGGARGLATSIVPSDAAAGYERLLGGAQAGLPDVVSVRRNAAQKARRLQLGGGGGR